MPRANRFFLPGHVWHITHRCHRKEFLLKFARDRKFWLRWLFEARKRYGLSVLNYMVTSNHVHLLVLDTGGDTIANSMQLLAGSTARAYNRRKQRTGAYWEDRYHATAVQSDAHLMRCLTYIDLNMVRAGVVTDPRDWPACGYHELMHPRQRYTITDIPRLLALLGMNHLSELQHAREHAVAACIASDRLHREDHWTQAIAVGSETYVDHIKRALGVHAKHRRIIEQDGVHLLKEPGRAYGNDFDTEKCSAKPVTSDHRQPRAVRREALHSWDAHSRQGHSGFVGVWRRPR